MQGCVLERGQSLSTAAWEISPASLA
uniref:Uncharacterized protein n=1 Tax=Anguilla anguilla TaxID=7936 RepID=A0A0E9S3J8_ANGAN